MTNGLTVTGRAEFFGLTYCEQRTLELAEPWLRSWAARHGEGLSHALAWLAAGRPIVDRSLIDIEGAPAIVAVVRDVISIVPSAVAWRLIEGRVQIRCGEEYRGQLSRDVRGQVDVRRDPLLVTVLAASEETTAHELGHAWCLVPNVAYQGLDAEQSERLHAALHTDLDEHTIDEIVHSTMVDEFAADRLATLWLGRSVDSTSGQHGEYRRRSIRAALGHGSTNPLVSTLVGVGDGNPAVEPALSSRRASPFPGARDDRR